MFLSVILSMYLSTKRRLAKMSYCRKLDSQLSRKKIKKCRHTLWPPSALLLQACPISGERTVVVPVGLLQHILEVSSADFLIHCWPVRSFILYLPTHMPVCLLLLFWTFLPHSNILLQNDLSKQKIHIKRIFALKI